MDKQKRSRPTGPRATFRHDLMSTKDFRESGLLYFVNTTVLWPLGLALAVSRDDAGHYSADLNVLRVEPAETITDGFTNDPDHPRYRVAAWITARLAAMDEDDRVLALALLADPMNVAAFLMAEPDHYRHSRPLPD